MGFFDKYLKKKIVSGGGGSAGAFEPEPYQPINFDEFLKAPSMEEMNQSQDTLLTFEKDYETITLAIEQNYELYKDFTKQLDDLELEMEEAPEAMGFSLNQKYNEIREQHNVLVESLQKDTKRQKEIHEEYTKVRTTYDKDIEIYNRWAEAQNAKEPEPIKPIMEGETSKPEDKPDPTWGQVVFHSLRAGLSSANKNFWNIGRMLEEGKIKAEETIDKLFFPGSEDRKEKFIEKYGKDPDRSWSYDILTKLVEDAEKIEAESAPQAESKAFLKQSLNIGLRPVPQIGMSILMGAAVPSVTGLKVTPTTEFWTAFKRMFPFMSLAGAGKGRDIENEYKEMGKEAPYAKKIVSSVLTGLAEGATEMPVFLGVSKIFKGGLKPLINAGAKAFLNKYGLDVAKNIFLQGIQEGEMVVIGKAIDEAMGDPQDWNTKDLATDIAKDFYGGIAMGTVMLGFGGGVTGSMKIAQKTKETFDRFVDKDYDLKKTLRILAEIQGIIPEEAEIEALAYEAKEIPELPSDRIRSELIKKAEESAEKPTREELFESEDLVIVRKEGEKYTYTEQWCKNCWEALLAKDEYKGLDRATAMEKFMEERFPKIAETENLKIDKWDYTKGRLTVEMTPKVAPKAKIKLFHLSTEQQLKEIDPEYMGEGQAGREMAKVGEEGFEKTSAWYTEETPKIEPRFLRNMLYTTEVEAKDIYDWKENPENLKTHSEIKEAGYKGYKIDDQVRLFEKVEVVREGIVVAEKGEKVAPKDIEKLIAPLKKIIDMSAEIAELHNKNEGSTYNLYDGDLIGREKYAVSVYPDRGITIKGKKVTPALIAKFIKDNMDLLKNPTNSVGTWYDEESKKTYIDVSQTIDTLKEALRIGEEHKQKEIFNLKTEESIPVIPSIEERLKDAFKEITRLKGILKTVKGNVKKRADFKKDLVKYIKRNMPYAIQNKMLATVKNVSGDKALAKALEKVDEYTRLYYGKQYIKAIENELKGKKIKPKRMKSGMLKGRFTPEIQNILDFIRANINGSRAEAIGKIQKNIEAFNEGKATDIAEENELLNMVGIREMDLETLQSTLANIKSLKKEGRTRRGIQLEKERVRHEQERIDAIETITGKEVEIDEESGKAKLDSSYKTLPKAKETKGIIKGIIKAIDGIVNWQFGWDNLLDKLSALDRPSLPYESKLSKIGDKVHYARVENMSKLEDVLTMIQIKFAEAFESTSKKEITKATRKLREEIDLGTFKNSEGDLVPFVLNKEQILKKVMQLDDPTLELTFDEMLYTDEIKDALRGAVSKKELAWIKGVREIYEYMWERVDPIFMEMYGIHFPHNPNYSGTIRRDVDIDIPEPSLMVQDAFKYASILNPSLKARSKTKQSLQYDEMTASLMNYVMQMEHFINFAKPLNDLRNVFGDKRVKSIINEIYGKDILNKINGFLDDITRDGVDRAKIIKWVDTIRFNFTRSILAKPHIGLKQIPSVLAYMTEMPIQDFFNGVGNFWKNPIKNYRYLVAHSAYARARFGEGFERDIHGAMQSDYVHLLSHTHKISDMTMGMVRAGDKFAVMQGMWAKFYSETKGQTTKAKNAEEGMRRAEISTQRTQPSFTIESLATGQRGGSFLKLFTMFQNQPNKYFRLIADNARNFRYGRGSRVKAASNIVLAWAVLPMLFQFIGDGGKWITRHQLRALILGVFNDILVFGSMIRGMYGWLIKEAYDINASPVFATLREIEYVLAKVAKWSDPDRDLTPEDIQAFTEHFAKGLGQLLGLPTPYGVQVKKAIQSGDYRQLLFSEYILKLSNKEKEKAKKPYTGKTYGKYLKSKYSKPSKYSKYLKY